MSRHRVPRRSSPEAIAAFTLALLIATASASDARVTRIVIDTKAATQSGPVAPGPAGPYETVSGRAYGELDPDDPRNVSITDIRLAPRNAAGKVEYMATFVLLKPIDMSRSSHLMWQLAPNRGRGDRIGLSELQQRLGDIGLISGWQGDNIGMTAQSFPVTNHYAVVPTARHADGSHVTGKVLGRILNASGAESQPLFVLDNQMPYQPLTLDTREAMVLTHSSERLDGVVGGTRTVPGDEWAWASCSAANTFPGTPDSTRICLKKGFDPALTYTVVFTAKDPYVLGVGFAAFRDVASFFKFERQDDTGTPNPLGQQVSWLIGVGNSQSGNFLKAFLHQGFNQDEAGRQVQDGSWPIVSAGQTPLNVRFALPDGAPRLYDFDREAPQWWAHQPDTVRQRAPNGILDRCMASRTCPKIVELFGAAEMWFLKMSPALVGTAADIDIALPSNVRRYYIASSPHGGGPGGFDIAPLPVPNGSGRGWGPCVLPANPMPYTDTRNALAVAFRNWVMNDAAMPPSRYPTLRDGTLVVPTKRAIGLPSIPGLPAGAPTDFINPVIRAEFGPEFRPEDQAGIITTQPPILKGALKMVVARVDADGNELGGVPVVLHAAPLGTYFGWNITAAGFFKGQICTEVGGMIPFARSRAERLATGDPRLSLEERYATHDGYVAAVRVAAANAVSAGFLLPEDATTLISQAAASNVLVP